MERGYSKYRMSFSIIGRDLDLYADVKVDDLNPYIGQMVVP